MGKIILETKNLSKKFGQRLAVNSVNLKVHKGDIFGFLGPNGAGKSTTIRMITGLVTPTSGRILFNNTLLDGKKHLFLRRYLGSLIEIPRFYEYLTAYENLELITQISGIKDKSTIDKALIQVGLYSRRNDRVRTFSQGMKQRLGIAQAIMGKPKLVILDEPTNGLDPEGINHIRRLILNLNKQKGITFMISSHILKEIESICNRVAILQEGKVLAQGRVVDLLNTPQEILTLEVSPVLKAINLLHSHPGVIKAVQNNNHLNQVKVFTRDLKPDLLNQYLVKNGIKVASLQKNNTSLEDFFLTLTRKKGELNCCGQY
ncbi:ABC transporter ATP-binding protein [Halothermothrix orenii]|uniref:ABC transporter related n=1 Tax=Halothermothrix orenii (strain H 168 / OCM 544 / DSM 9562) TaxID=373903 RepID=B8D130_HALOH|nr:ABC transporter ATP-binding protein [Halothermothrix orenii]ACL68999.1 ABC transporter related [Halothermothrix orenii H 168]